MKTQNVILGLTIMLLIIGGDIAPAVADDTTLKYQALPIMDLATLKDPYGALDVLQGSSNASIQEQLPQELRKQFYIPTTYSQDNYLIDPLTLGLLTKILSRRVSPLPYIKIL